MELDTGSAHSVVGEQVWKTLGSPILTNAPSLTAYGGFPLSLIWQVDVEVGFQGEIWTLNLVVVVHKASTSLLRREWMHLFPRLRTLFDSAPINSIFVTNAKVALLGKELSDLVELNLGKIKDYKAQIYVMPDSHFRYFKPRQVVFALCEQIEKYLDRLLKLGVIERVQPAEFGATQVVLVAKPINVVWICWDFRVTVNSYADMQRYPLLHLEKLRAALSGKTIVLKMDFANAYLQMEVNEESRKYLVLLTHIGRFRNT